MSQLVPYQQNSAHLAKISPVSPTGAANVLLYEDGNVAQISPVVPAAGTPRPVSAPSSTMVPTGRVPATAKDEVPPWTESAIRRVQINLLCGVFACRTPEAVRAAIGFTQFLRSNDVNDRNWGLYLRLLEVENHWVIDALIGDSDPYLLISPIQPNYFMLKRSFSLLTKWHPREIYPRSLQVILGILQITYTNPQDGYDIYPLTVVDVQNLGKHLNPRLGQDDNINRFILDILDGLSSLAKSGGTERNSVGEQANRIRNAFFDHKKSLVESVPQVLLVEGDYAQGEVPPEIDIDDQGLKESLRVANKRIQDLQDKIQELESEGYQLPEGS